MTVFNSLWFGLTLPLRSAALVVKSPVLLAAGFVPWLLSVAIDAWFVHRLQAWTGAWISSVAWIHTFVAIEWLIQALTWVAIIIAGALAFSVIAGTVALPFSDWLAELTETRAFPPLPAVTGLTLGRRVRLLAVDLLKTFFALGLSIFALILSLVPVVNILGVTLTFLLVTFQFISYPQTRRGQGIRDGIRFLFKNLPACLGFGASYGFLFALPLISTLALPLAVVGGTLLYARLSTNKVAA